MGNDRSRTFATNSAPGYSIADSKGNELVGLFYGGGFKLLGLQLTGFVSVAAWTAVTITIVFLIIKATLGLRVTEEEEIIGLDPTEHGLPSAYAGFAIMDVSGDVMDVNENTDLGSSEYKTASTAAKEAAVPVVSASTSPSGLHKVVIIAKLSRYDKLRKAMNDLGVTGMTVTQVMGCGIQKGAGEKYRGAELDATLLPKSKSRSNCWKDSGRISYRDSKEDSLHWTYRRWKDLRIRCGTGCQGSYRRRRSCGITGCRVMQINLIPLAIYKLHQHQKNQHMLVFLCLQL